MLQDPKVGGHSRGLEPHLTWNITSTVQQASLPRRLKRASRPVLVLLCGALPETPAAPSTSPSSTTYRLP